MTRLTLNIDEAADMLKVSRDALLRKARAGTVPGAKVGRRWVFIRDDLLALIREQAKARVCQSIAIHRARTGTSGSASRLDRAECSAAKRAAESLALQVADIYAETGALYLIRTDDPFITKNNNGYFRPGR